MGKLYYLAVVLALVVLTALPSYCELKAEESLNFDVMHEADDIPEPMRTKRRLQSTNDQDLIKSHKRKLTPKEKETINQKIEDLNALKRKSSVLNLRESHNKQRTLNAMSTEQENEVQKSGHQQLSEYTANKKSIATRDIRNRLEKSVPREVKEDEHRSCIADKEGVDEIKRSHSLDKRSEVTPIKSENKNKTRRESKLITLNESESRKKEILNTNNTVNDLKKNVSKKTGTLSKDLEKDDNEDKQIKRSQNVHKKSKREAFDYFNIFPRIQETLDDKYRKNSRKRNSKLLQEPQSGHNEEDEDDYNEDDDLFNKYRNPVILDEVIPKFYIPQPDVIHYVNNRTKFSRVLP